VVPIPQVAKRPQDSRLDSHSTVSYAGPGGKTSISHSNHAIGSFPSDHRPTAMCRAQLHSQSRIPRSPEQTCESNISSSKLEGVSETVANPTNPRPQSAIVEPPAATADSTREEPLTAHSSTIPGTETTPLDTPLDSQMVTGWVGRLAAFQREVTDAERIDQIRALERLKSAAAAAQARITVDLDTSIRAAHAAAGIPTDRQGRGVAGQVAFARQESPTAAPSTSAWARCWSARCRTPSPLWNAG
jgi:hypothetical protein